MSPAPRPLSGTQRFTLMLRVTMEMGIVAALACWGLRTSSSTGVKVLFGIAAPVVGFGIWGAVDFHQAGRHAENLRLAEEIVISGLAAVALYTTGPHAAAVALALLSIAYHVVVYATGATLLKPGAASSRPRGHSTSAVPPNRPLDSVAGTYNERNATRMTQATNYKKPGWFTRNVFNRGVAIATRMGLSVWGSRILQVRGRNTGQIRETPINLLNYDGYTYLVAPRGVTQWVRNLRIADEGTLRLGRHVQPFRSEELDNEAKPEVLRAYLRRWKMEVGVFFDGIDADSPRTELARIAPDHPVFLIRTAAP